MSTQEQKIAKGINYIRMLKGMNVNAIAFEMKEDVEHVKECIALARKNKDEADRKVRVTLSEPELEVLNEYHTGAMQVVKEIDITIRKPLIVKYSRDKVTEFQTLLPVTIKITRP